MTHPDIAYQFNLNKDKIFNELIQDLIYMISTSNDSGNPINNQVLTNRLSKTMKDLEKVVDKYKNWAHV